jgi:hypothetical protein
MCAFLPEPRQLSYSQEQDVYYCTTVNGLYLSNDGLVWTASELFTSSGRKMLHRDEVTFFQLDNELVRIDHRAAPSFHVEEQNMITAPDLHEISGIVASRKHPGVYWAITDSGGDAVVYALNSDGSLINAFNIPMSDNRDYEDIAIGNLAGSPQEYIFIADTGDNNHTTGLYQIYAVPEPDNPYGTPIDLPLDNVFHFNYPDYNYDCETLMLDPITGNFYLLIKSGVSDGGVENRLFELAAPHVNGLRTAIEVGQPVFPPDGFLQRGSTAGDVSPNGREILVKTYDHIYYWYRTPEQTIPEAMSVQPIVLPYIIETQGESLCWGMGNETYFTASENINTMYKYKRNNYQSLALPFAGFNDIAFSQTGELLCSSSDTGNPGIKRYDEWDDLWQNLIAGVIADKLLALPDQLIVWTDESGNLFLNESGENFQISYSDQIGVINSAVYKPSDDLLILATNLGAFTSDNYTGNQESIHLGDQMIKTGPNPFNDSVEFTINADKQTRNAMIEIFNIKGQKVRTITTDKSENGSFKAIWNGLDERNNSMGSGVYLYRVNTGESISSGKLIRLK